MITITPAAAEQIKLSAKQNQAEALPLRIAAKREADGSIQYAMGFADENHADDILFKSEGVDIVVTQGSAVLLSGTTMDFVELEQGEYNFIFMNPNDPTYSPVSEE
ncbi:MAG: iron-sulfur cluster assembly accessory protein [Gammaproteobacteria bacterium]|nr:iron-sulfur cluster assembly accessory protein [Gammaproteobacteria bacterium]